MTRLDCPFWRANIFKNIFVWNISGPNCREEMGEHYFAGIFFAIKRENLGLTMSQVDVKGGEEVWPNIIVIIIYCVTYYLDCNRLF
jgi:hypothetical protein